MPPPRKVDLLPPELRAWLQEELRTRGFGGYEEVASALNFRLEEAGSEVRIQKSAIHAFGAEYQAFVKAQEQASAWAVGWMQEQGLEEEAKRHNVLFQMVTTLAFKVMQSQMTKEGDEIEPQQLHFLGRMLKDVMQSSGIRQQVLAAHVKAQSAKLEAAVSVGDIDAEAAAKARKILGFA